MLVFPDLRTRFIKEIERKHKVPVVRRKLLGELITRLDPDRQLYHAGTASFPLITRLHYAKPFSLKHPFGAYGTTEIGTEKPDVCRAVARMLNGIKPWARDVLIELIDPYTLYGFAGRDGNIVFTFAQGPEGTLEPHQTLSALRTSGLPAVFYVTCDFDCLSETIDSMIENTGLAVLIVQDSRKRNNSGGEFEVIYATK